MTVDYFAWVHAWEAAMHEAGYPRARLNIVVTHIEPDRSALMCDYSWVHDLNYALNPQAGDPPQGAWEMAHRAFVLVDHLRPYYVTPSIMLMKFLAEAGHEG